MPFPMRIQPIDASQDDVAFVKHHHPQQQSVTKSRLRRLFDRPFRRENDAVPAPIEPSSLCLDKMVRNFIEDSNNNNDRAVKCGRNRCNCFNGNSNGSSDDEDEFDFFSDSVTTNSSSSSSDCSDSLKSLIPCASVVERNLLADTSRIVEKNSKSCKRKDDLRKIVTESLIALGYDASVCESKWEKSSSIPAGEYEYIDVIANGERLIVDVDFRSEFEIARSTSSYKQILQSLPSIFVGKSDRLLQIVTIATEAVRQSLRKKGMHVAPWRKAEYVKSKWLSPYTRKLITGNNDNHKVLSQNDTVVKKLRDDQIRNKKTEEEEGEAGELDLIFGVEEEEIKTMSSSDKGIKTEVVTWQLPAVRSWSLERGRTNNNNNNNNNNVLVTGLASLLK